MKISVTKLNIKAALENAEKMTPIELAILDLGMFEEVILKEVSEDKFSVYIDDMNVVLPTKANRALVKFNELAEMKPFSFELALEQELDIPTGDLEIMDFEESYDFGFDLGFA
ncbi:MAG: hypothetical protein MRZ79_01825 [Bacteroidia bacterium]|nr:hypothetical protein [Bacteroidia bacterium]